MMIIIIICDVIIVCHYNSNFVVCLCFVLIWLSLLLMYEYILNSFKSICTTNISTVLKFKCHFIILKLEYIYNILSK